MDGHGTRLHHVDGGEAVLACCEDKNGSRGLTRVLFHAASGLLLLLLLIIIVTAGACALSFLASSPLFAPESAQAFVHVEQGGGTKHLYHKLAPHMVHALVHLCVRMCEEE